MPRFSGFLIWVLLVSLLTISPISGGEAQASAPPTIGTISPSSGPIAGGTSVAIQGTGFSGTTGVTFGGVAASSFTVDSDANIITAVTPSSTAGSAQVVVTNASGPSTTVINFVFAPVPTISNITPATGATTGSTSITVTGTGFFGGGSAAAVTGVTVGGIAATSVVVNSDTELTAVTPSGTAGAQNVVVSTPGGSSAPGTFTYEVTVAAPIIANTGFEDGTLGGWTASSDPLTSFSGTLSGSGQGAGRISGSVTFTHGSRSARPNCEAAVSPATWTFGPASSKSGALQANGSSTFDQATSALGLSNADNSAIKAVIVSQASTSGCGGSTNPTDAAWIKQTVTLQANTTYRMAWNYLGTDYTPYNDGSITSLVFAPSQAGTPVVTVNNQVQNYALLGFTNPGTGDYSTGSYGSTGWQYATYQVSITGDYVLGFASFNIGDTSLSPVLLIDDTLGTVLKNGVAFGAVVPNNPNAPVTVSETVPGSPTITSITPGSGQLQINFNAPGSNGGSAITNYKYSTDGVNYLALSPASTTSPLTISFLSSDGTTPLVNGTAYSITLKAVNSVGDSAASAAVSGTPIAPVVTPSSSSGPVQQAVTPIVPQRPRQIVLPPQGPVQAPVLQNNQPPLPPTTPQALLNGVPTQLQTLVTDPNNLNLRTGVLNIGMNVRSDQGLVRQGTNGETEVQVRKGGVAGFQGTGLAPRSFVQVFMPLQGTNSKELARIPVDETGSFNGEAVFQTSFQEAPLPIGRQVLQMVTVDEQGRQNVVEITVNIVQPQPAPELNRQDGTTPQLRPGQSLATNAGVPEVVEVTVIEDQKQTVIEGDGWAMSIAPEDENSNVIQNEDGEVFLELVRDEAAAVSGTGFLPGTRADIWLFSEPTLLGTVDIDENGEFNGTVEIDGQMVNVGEHTLQMQGVGKDGYVRAANLGVVVNDADALSTEEAAGSFLWWWLLLLLIIAIAVSAYLWWRKRQLEAIG